MQSVGQHKYEFVTVAILLANYSGIFVWPHTGNGYSHSVLVNIANTDLGSAA